MKHNSRFQPILCGLLLFSLLTACSPVAIPPAQVTQAAPTVTADVFAAPTPTPFQPTGDVPVYNTTIPVQDPTQIPPTATSESLTPSPTGTSSPVPIDLPTIQPADAGYRAQYFLNVVLDYYAHTLSVGELIGYPNMSGVPLNSLVLAVEPNLWTDSFILDSLAVNGVPAAYTLTAGRLEVPLGAPLEPGKSATIGINYRLLLPYAGTSNIYGYNSLQVNLLDWYPYVVPYDPTSGWLLHERAAVGEHLVYDVSDFDVTVQVTPGEIVVAAGASAEWNGKGWHYRLTGRTFALSMSDSYQVASTAAGAITVSTYYFPSESAAATVLMQEVAKAMVTYGEAFGAAPYNTLSIVEAAAYGDGMEADGLFFLGRKFYQAGTSVQSDLVSLGVHEAAHTWWFGSVGNDQALEPWLDETLALYSEHIFYEENYPGLVNWWWNFRVNHYSPTGWVDHSIYSAGPFRSYVNAVYLRGADFMDALRSRIGDEAFLAFLRDYATQMAGKRATAEDFFRILRTHTDADISDITGAFFQVPH